MAISRATFRPGASASARIDTGRPCSGFHSVERQSFDPAEPGHDRFAWERLQRRLHTRLALDNQESAGWICIKQRGKPLQRMRRTDSLRVAKHALGVARPINSNLGEVVRAIRSVVRISPLAALCRLRPQAEAFQRVE